MKTTHTIAQLFPVARSRLTQIELDIAAQPESWHQLLQKAINAGAFLKLELGFGIGGLVDVQLLLVSKKGEATPVSIAGSAHA